MSGLTISAVVPVYNGEPFVAETLTAILGQTRPPDQVVVVDDGSTDGTRDVLEQFRGAVELIHQENRSAAGAYNTGFAHATGDFVARCDADDVWLPDKLAWQAAALTADPSIDVAIGDAWVFGREERPFCTTVPGKGVLDARAFARATYRRNEICSSTGVIRRTVLQAIGPLVEHLVCEDYDLWLRAMKAGATFAFDPRTLVRYRQHGANVTNGRLAMYEATYQAHRWHADLVDDDRLVRRVLARDLRAIARLVLEEEGAAAARRAYVGSLRLRPTPKAAAWAALLSLPGEPHRAVLGALLPVKRRVLAAGRRLS